MLRVEGISTYYGRMQVLHEVSLRIHPGETVAVLGPNGAGKSTLMKTIAGLVPPRSGSVTLEGRNVTRLPADLKVRLGVALVAERRELFDGLTVFENLQLGAYIHRGRSGAAQFRQKLSSVYELFPILAERQNQRAELLSGGQQQMLAIGRALMSEPRLLLLDEPFMGLAPLVIRDILAVLARLKSEGLTILVTEQNITNTLAFSDRGYVLSTGYIRLEDRAEALLEMREVQSLYLS